MKILLIAQFGLHGGTREVFKRILKIHLSRGYETRVLIQHDSDETIKEFIIQKGASFTELPRRGALYNSFFMSLLYEHRNYVKPIKEWVPDLIVASIGNTAHGHSLFALNCPLIYLLHTIPVDLNFIIKAYYKSFSFLANSNQLICGVSKASIQAVRRNWGFNKNQTAILYNTFNKDHINHSKRETADSQITILTLGHVVSYKNPSVWLEVARLVTLMYKHVQFIWLGEGALLEMYREETKNETQLSFLGHSDDVQKFYGMASIYFQPSKIENHSLSVLDAMANGIPCVVSNVGGQGESIQDGVNGFLCEPDNVSEYVEKISLLIKDSKKRDEMGKNGKSIALKSFNPETYPDRLLSLYKEVLNSK
jgi:glycosyltransferase involved in cell wall biosynthesis